MWLRLILDFEKIQVSSPKDPPLQALSEPDVEVGEAPKANVQKK